MLTGLVGLSTAGGRFVLQSEHEEAGAEECVGAVQSNLGCGAEVCCSLWRERSGVCLQESKGGCTRWLCLLELSLTGVVLSCFSASRVVGRSQHNAVLFSAGRHSYHLRQQTCKRAHAVRIRKRHHGWWIDGPATQSPWIHQQRQLPVSFLTIFLMPTLLFRLLI